MHPFLKWPGGKRWLIARYQHIFPQDYNVYFEPFLGGGSAFFYLKPLGAVLSDINQDLINTYRAMARYPDQLRIILNVHQEKHSTKHYYSVRKDVPNDLVEQAARFLYLNRTCFNGMYRVNLQGQFNVPIGTKQNFLDDIHEFEKYAKVLGNAHIRKMDFVEAIRGANEGDLVFADPPYTIAQIVSSNIMRNCSLGRIKHDY